MFGFFKKTKNTIKNIEENTLNNLSFDQKDAICFVAFQIVIKSNVKIHPKEQVFIQDLINLLRIDKKPTGERFFNNPNETTRILNTLDQFQKNWFVIIMHDLMTVKGNTVDVDQAGYLLEVFNGIGISNDDYVEIVQFHNNIG